MQKIRYENVGLDMINVWIEGFSFTFNPKDTMLVSSDNFGDTTFNPKVIVDMDDEYIYID